MVYNTLLDGRKMTDAGLTEFYRYNLRNGLVPVAGYFCPKCHHEVNQFSDGSMDVCYNCKYDWKKE